MLIALLRLPMLREDMRVAVGAHDTTSYALRALRVYSADARTSQNQLLSLRYDTANDNRHAACAAVQTGGTAALK